MLIHIRVSVIPGLGMRRASFALPDRLARAHAIFWCIYRFLLLFWLQNVVFALTACPDIPIGRWLLTGGISHVCLRRRARNAAKRTEPTHRVRRSRVRDTSIAVTRHTRPTLIMDRNARSCLAACAKPRRTETRGLSAARRDSRPGTPASLRPAPVMPISC